MAVAAYASVLSVLHVLNQIQHPVHLRLLLNTNKIQTLHENVSFLQEFLEIPLGANSEDIEDLTRQIAEVANEAEDIIDFHVVNQLDGENEEKSDIIETHVVDQLLEGSENKTDTRLSSSFCQDIDKVIEKIDSIKKKLTMVKGKCVVQGQQSRASVTASPSRLPSNGRKNTMVGFDDHLVRIMDKLTGHQLNLEIIPIAGMGGIGKTTLARNVFENKCVVEHFDICAWFTISQQYSVHEILQGILQGIGVFEDSFELGTRLYQHLSGRRYLIVMDDMWSTEAWDDLRLFFPDNRKGSRIMITTRLLDVAISLSSRNLYSMDFLDEDKSWGLLCEKAFSQGSASPELEDIGKKIARSCRGLPLAIVVIGGLLGNSNMTREYWEFIAENVISYANSENDEHCLKIVALSYNHLPIHLKPCFLYMRAFPEDHEVPVSELIKFWVAEGFLKPITTKTLEEVAEEYLKSLIDRSLILIRRRGRTGKIRTCGVHDVLRDLCLRESRKEQFFGLPKVQHPIYFARERGEHVCFLCCKRVTQEMRHLPRAHLDSGSTSLVSSFVCNACRIICPQYICLRWVRLVDIDSHQEYLLQHVKLRYLSFPYIRKFVSPSSIPLLWNLQSLIIDSSDVHSIVLPSEIWEMPQLRHIVINHCFLPDPIVNEIERKDLTILENLQTLSAIGNLKCMENVFERIPNLKKLRIRYNYGDEREDWYYYSLDNLDRLNKLESLSFECCKFVLKNITFPYSLKKLSLSRCGNPWEDMTIIGSLPNLEVLKLSLDAFTGSEWSPIEGEFLRLKALYINDTYLKCWRAENIHFPILETLKLRKMYSLEEIPRSIGDIATLRLIHLVSCFDLVDSVREILEEQRSFGNEDLQVQVFDRKGRRCCEWLDSI